MPTRLPSFHSCDHDRLAALGAMVDSFKFKIHQTENAKRKSYHRHYKKNGEAKKKATKKQGYERVLLFKGLRLSSNIIDDDSRQ